VALGATARRTSRGTAHRVSVRVSDPATTRGGCWSPFAPASAKPPRARNGAGAGEAAQRARRSASSHASASRSATSAHQDAARSDPDAGAADHAVGRGSLYLVEINENGDKRLRFRLAQTYSKPEAPFVEHTIPVDRGSLAGYAP